MSGISNKPLDAIDEEDLKSLVDEHVLEYREIEYKKTFPNFSIPRDKKEFLADVSSFANASGGDLIYGIEEDKGIPINLCGLAISESDIDTQNENRGHNPPKCRTENFWYIDPTYKIGKWSICNYNPHPKKLGITTHGNS